ncbi:hypothetical protein AcW2_005697 [Taiwanofungus camphoratus]|nr:hypothetical protein AcW2_005697 [Antrodia cinnamomea]
MRIGRVAARVGLYVQEDPPLIYDGDAIYVLLPWVLVPLSSVSRCEDAGIRYGLSTTISLRRFREPWRVTVLCTDATAFLGFELPPALWEHTAPIDSNCIVPERPRKALWIQVCPTLCPAFTGNKEPLC